MDTKSKATFSSIFPWILYGLAIFLTGYLVGTGNKLWISYLRSVLLLNGGVQGLIVAFGHLFFPKQTSRTIGWQSSPFQTEMGFTNLAIGITSIVSFFLPSWALATGLILAILWLGCALVHIRDRVVNKNEAPCNSGPMLYNTLFVSITLFITIGVLLYS